MRLGGRLLRQRYALLRERRAIAFVALLALTFLLLSFAVHTPQLLRMDRAVTLEVQDAGNDGLTRLARGFTFLGNIPVLIAVALAAAVFLLYERRPRAALLSVATLLSLPLNYLIKELIGRPRPDGELINVLLPTVGLSFPSGHAMGSVMVYGFLAFLAWVHVAAPGPRRFWTVTLALVPLGVSLSRVYVGAHWLSDVIGGWVAGLGLVLLLAEIYQVSAKQELAPRTRAARHGETRVRPHPNHPAH